MRSGHHNWGHSEPEMARDRIVEFASRDGWKHQEVIHALEAMVEANEITVDERAVFRRVKPAKPVDDEALCFCGAEADESAGLCQDCCMLISQVKEWLATDGPRPRRALFDRMCDASPVELEPEDEERLEKVLASMVREGEVKLDGKKYSIVDDEGSAPKPPPEEPAPAVAQPHPFDAAALLQLVVERAGGSTTDLATQTGGKATAVELDDLMLTLQTEGLVAFDKKARRWAATPAGVRKAKATAEPPRPSSLDVACPKCKAAPGVGCTQKGSAPSTEKFHGARDKAFNKWIDGLADTADAYKAAAARAAPPGPHETPLGRSILALLASPRTLVQLRAGLKEHPKGSIDPALLALQAAGRVELVDRYWQIVEAKS